MAEAAEEAHLRAPLADAGSAQLESGDSDEAFVQFARAVTPGLLRTVQRVAAPGTDYEDLVSEALARAYLHWRRIAPLHYRTAWVHRVALHLAYDTWRRRRLGSPGWRNDPEAGNFDGQSVDRLRVSEALRRLSPRQRQAVSLRYLADLPVDEVAEAMHVSAGTARKHIERGRDALRSLLGGAFEEETHASD